MIYDYDTRAERTGVATLLGELGKAGVRIRDLHTNQSSLEEIFVGGIRSNVDLHRRLIAQPDFINGDYDIGWLERLISSECPNLRR